MADAFGLLAEFETPSALVAAAREARRQGYRALDTFTPFPVPEIDAVLRLRDSRVLWLGLFGGIFGFALALAMQTFVSFSYPINVGGRPLYALSAFAVIAFELTVLFAALTPALGMLVMNGLPRLNHPMFNWERFKKFSDDKFFCVIEARDPKYAERSAQEVLQALGGQHITVVHED